MKHETKNDDKISSRDQKSGKPVDGWLIDLPGVDTQEKNKEKCVESLRIGPEDMLATEVLFESRANMITVEVSESPFSKIYSDCRSTSR